MPGIDDLFPDHPRTLYSTNPLKEVVCELRFPPILRIQATPPAEFQERVREELPLLERAAVQGIQQIPQELLQLIGMAQSASGYIFRTADRASSVTLMVARLPVSTEKYARWEGFWSLAEKCAAALTEIYSPNFFTRLGLRYRNVIRRSELGLDGEPWSNLISPPVLGELADQNWERSAVEAVGSIRCRGGDDGDGVLFQHGLLKEEGKDEHAYLIDFDFYRDGRVEVDDIEGVFSRLNRRTGRAFRWTISDRLHEALGPVPL